MYEHMCSHNAWHLCARSGAVTQLESQMKESQVDDVSQAVIKHEQDSFWGAPSTLGTQKEEINSPTFKRMTCSRRQTVGKYVITVKGDLVLIHTTDYSEINEKGVPVAFFRAPSDICSIDCAGDKITVVCDTGEELVLRAPLLAPS